MLTSDDRAVAQAALTAAREQTQGTIATLTHDLGAVIEAAAGVNADDEHDPEGATVAFERAQLAALLDSARLLANEIGAAFDRVEAGSYGSCEQCRAAIAPERLAARPATRYCAACAGRGAGRRL